MPTLQSALAVAGDDAGVEAGAWSAGQNYVAMEPTIYGLLRFLINIPPHASIQSAYLTVVPNATVDASLGTFTFDYDDSAAWNQAMPTDTAGYGARVWSTLKATGTFGSVTEGVAANSPNLARLFQAIVNDPAWTGLTGGNVVILRGISDVSNFNFASVENVTYDPAFLRVTYTLGGTGTARFNRLLKPAG